MKSRTEYVAINTGANFAIQLVSNLMKAVLKFVFIRTLGAQYNGVSSLFGDVLSMLSLAELGIASAIAYALYKPLKNQDNERLAALMHFYKKAYRLVAGFVVLVGVALLPFLHLFVRDVPDITENIRLIFILFVIESACSYLLIYKSTLFSAGQRRYVISNTSIAFSLARTAIQCVLLLIFHNYILFLVVSIVETLLRNLTLSRLADKHFPDIAAHSDARLTRDETRSLIHDVFALSLYRVNAVILNSTDSLFISAMLPSGIEEVGYVSVYRTIIRMISSFIGQIHNALLPSIGHLATDATPEKQFSVFKSLLFISFWCNCFSTASLFVLSSPLVRLATEAKYVIGTSVLIALLIDNYYVSMLRTLSTFRTANGLFVQGKYRPLFTSLLDIVFTLLLIKPYGVFGVVIATSLAHLCTSFWYEPWLLYTKIFHMPLRDFAKRYGLYTGLTVLLTAATYCAATFVRTPNAYLNFVIMMALCVIIPNGAVILIFRKTAEYREFVERLGTLAKKLRTALIKRRAQS